ncbi:MAG TPA: hypothetical protein VF993_14235 [Myxococcales bacterium]
MWRSLQEAHSAPLQIASKRRDAIERVEVLGAEAQLEIAAAVGFGAQARSGQVGVAQVDPGFIDDDSLFHSRRRFSNEARNGREGSDPDRLARVGQLVEHHLAVELAAGLQLCSDGAHPACLSRRRFRRKFPPLGPMAFFSG